MKKIEIDTYFGDKPTYVELAAPMGAGGTYHVVINKYYNGILMMAYDGWRIHLHPTTILQGDDVTVILELIEENLLEKI